MRVDATDIGFRTLQSRRYCCLQLLQILSIAGFRAGGGGDVGATSDDEYYNLSINVGDDDGEDASGGDLLIAEAVDKVIINLCCLLFFSLNRMAPFSDVNCDY